MDERLRQFLAMESLTPAQFADVMGIQRSGISHLLAGRNKPSFEFIQKMLTAYPNLNPQWLILGKGKPYIEVVEAAEKRQATETPKSFVDQIPLFVDDLPADDEDAPLEDSEAEKVNVIDDIPNISEPSTIVSNNKRISRITVFYTDGTFEER